MVACYALRGSTGFGAAAAMPLLALVIPLKVLIPAWTLIGLTAGVTLLGRDRAHIAWSAMGRLWLSGKQPRQFKKPHRSSLRFQHPAVKH